MKKARPRLTACLFASFLAGLAVPGPHQVRAAEPRVVKVMTSLPTLTVAVPFVAMARHYDTAHGIAVDMSSAGGSSPLMISAVLSGDVEFATPGTPTALQAIREGADIRIIAAIANNQIATVINNATMKRLNISPSAPIGDRIRALKGLTIGTNPVGATYYLMLRTYLKQYGVDPDRDVRLVGIAESSALISGLEQGRFDAIVSASGVVEQAITLGAGTMWFSGARGDIPGAETAVVCVVIARSDTIEKHPQDVAAIRAALSDALVAVREDHTATGQLLKEKYFGKLDPAVWDLVWGGATAAYPPTLGFTRAAYDFWVANDPKGAENYRAVDYTKLTYGPAQAP